MKYTCRHPHTGEFVELTNREWRCVKAGIPATSSLWDLLVAEKEYRLLLLTIAEYPFDKLTIEWLASMIETWPVDVLCTPQALLCWYNHITDFYDLPNIGVQLAQAQELRSKMDKLVAKKNKMLLRVAKDLQKQLKAYKKAKENRAKYKRRRR